MINTYTLKTVVLTAVTKAIQAIRDEASCFEREAKENYDPAKEDVVTSADKRAQALYVEILGNAFPTYGIIGEENGLCKPCTDGDAEIYFTVDPLDGTKAFARRQSHGVGTMIGLVKDGEVVVSYIGDINTGEVFGYAGDGAVTRDRFGVESVMTTDIVSPLGKQYIMLNDPLLNFNPFLNGMIQSVKQGGLFKDYEVTHGSVGLQLARLWKGEVGAVMLGSAYDTPWDSTPIIGTNRKLGVVSIKIDPKTGEVEVFAPSLPKKVQKKPYIELYVHRSKVDEILNWIKVNA